MALTTRNNRASAIGIGLAFIAILPHPDGTIVFADQQQVAQAYAGIAAADTFYQAPADRTFTVPAESRTFTV